MRLESLISTIPHGSVESVHIARWGAMPSRNLIAAMLLATFGGGCAAALPSPSGTRPSAEANPQNWPVSSSPASFGDRQTEERIDTLIAKMTIEQKVGQLIQADISAISPEDLAKYPLGSILAGGNSGPNGNERSTARDWHKLVQAFRSASSAHRANGVAIPIIFGVDAVHGHNNIPGATIFPHNVGLGAARDPELIRKIAEVTAREVAASGIEWTFAPTLAVPQDLRWGRTYEGYSSDPALVTRYAREMVLGLQGKLEPGRSLAPDRVAATAKHFLADGGTAGGKDQGDARLSEAELVAIHGAPYPAAIESGALTVMASFSSWNGVKHHGNQSLLTNVLKERMGFAGFVVGDWNGHGHVVGCQVTDCPVAINAGLDMFMAPDSWKGLYENTLLRARAGDIPQSRIDDAVRRILRVKAKLGLLDPGGRDPSPDYSVIGSADHLALAREAVAKSLVLLKNNDAILPVRPGSKVLVTGSGADNLAMQSGGWTISWQGTDVVRSDFPNGRTIWDGIRDSVQTAGGAAALSPDGSFTDRPDVAIVVFGERPYAEYQGDVSTLDYQPAGAIDLALIKRLKQAGIKVVSVFISGRPMFTNPEINASDAFVAAWLPGTQGDGVADVLVARRDGRPLRDFTGRLSFPWPGDARSPIAVPQFPLGYGLDYRQRASVPQLPEDLGLDLAQALNRDSFFSNGRAQLPWTMTISDAGGPRPVEAVAVMSPAGYLASTPTGVAAQDDSIRLSWRGPASVSIDGPAADMRDRVGSHALAIRYRLESKSSGGVKLAFGDIPLDVSSLIAAGNVGQLDTLAIPLRCFAAAGADMTNVLNAMRLSAESGLGLTLIHARLEPAEAGVICPSAAK